MRIKFRSLWTLVLLCLCCFLTACARETMSEQITEVQDETAESAEIPTATEPTDYVPEMSGKIDFRYIYRGFTGVPLDNREEIEKFGNFGVQMIATEDEWHAFMDTYCPGIPYNESWDFQEDYLLASVTASKDPAFAVADAVAGLTWENGSFVCEYEKNPNHYVYALNTGEYTHFYVEVIAISKESRGTTPERTKTQPTGGNFETLYRGFTLVSLEDRDTFDKFMQFGTQIIGTAEDFDAFLDFYCPGNPCDMSLDFSEECVIATIMLGAKPGYAMTHKSLGIDPETGYLNIELDQLDPVYALNSGEYGHYFVELIKVNRSELPDNTDSWTYHSE